MSPLRRTSLCLLLTFAAAILIVASLNAPCVRPGHSRTLSIRGTLVVMVPSSGGLVIAADSRSSPVRGIDCDDQVKIFEPTTTLKVSLFLVADSFPPDGARGEEEFELGLSAAASIAHHLIDRGGPVGLISNARMEDSGQAIQIPAGGSDDQRMEILEALAKATPRFKDPAEAFWQRESKSLPSGTTLIVIASRVPDPLLWLLREWKEKGSPLLLLLTGDRQESGGEEFLPACSIRNPGSLLKINPEAPG